MVIDHWLSHRLIVFGRSALQVAGRLFLLADSCSWQQQRASSVWHGIFKQMWAWLHSPSCNGLKGAWPSALGPSIMHFDAWWPKRPSLPFNEKCLLQKRWMPTPYHIEIKGVGDWGLRRVTSLGVRILSILMLGLTPQTKQCNACIQTWLKNATWG